MYIFLNKDFLLNDIGELLKAFYPQEELFFFIKEDARSAAVSEKGAVLLTPVNNSSAREAARILKERDGRGFKGKITPERVKNSNLGVLPDLEIMYSDTGVCIDGTCFEMASDDKSRSRNELKRALYQVLSGRTGRQLPWGSLTGVRPTKFPIDMYKKGCTEDEIRAFMRQSFFTSDKKIELSMGIAKRELEILRRLDLKGGFSLYVGIPFCPSRCFYCSFASYPIDRYPHKAEGYIERLIEEMRRIASKRMDSRLCSVYVGGGTPTALSATLLDRLLCALDESFDMGGAYEYTVEAGRPDSLDSEKLEVLRRHRVSRISINPQTMNDDTLRIIGRNHTSQDIKRAFYMAREAGFDNINMDIILGLPDEGIKEVSHTLDEIEALSPESITVHSLAVKRTAKLNMESERYSDYGMVNTGELVELCADRCEEMGCLPYYMYRQKNMKGNLENVGYAKKGREGIYNILMMEDIQDIEAIGAGTVSKTILPSGRIDRRDSPKELELFIGSSCKER